MPLAVPVLWSTQATVAHPSGFGASTRLWVVGPRPLPYGATSSTVALVDVGASYRQGHIQIDVQLDNLFNSRWKEGEYNFASWFDRDTPRSAIPALHHLAGPPRTVRVGLTLWL